MTGFTLITASKIQNSSGRLLASGRVSFFPTNNNGDAVSAIAGGGGMIMSRPVTFVVSNGAITTDLYGNQPQVADTALTNPANICYRITVVDENSDTVQGPGYGLAQPSGASWSLDTYVPVQPFATGPGPSSGGTPPPVITASVNTFSVVPSGAVDGVNVTFVVGYTATLLFVYVAGIFQTPGVDYFVSGGVLTFIAGSIPQPGEVVYALGIF